MTYRPSPESLPSKVLCYFALHPDEVLRVEDIAAKFQAPGDCRSVHAQLVMACDHDMLVWDPAQFGGIYRKGPVDLPSVRPDATLGHRCRLKPDHDSDHLQDLLATVAVGVTSDVTPDPMARGAALVLASVEQARAAPAGQGHLSLATGLSAQAWMELDLMPPDDRALFISGLIAQLCAAVPMGESAAQNVPPIPAGGLRL